MDIPKSKLRVLAHKIVKELHSEVFKYKDCMESPHRMEEIICRNIENFQLN